MIIITKLLIITLPLVVVGIIATNFFSNIQSTGSVQGKKTEASTGNSAKDNQYLNGSIHKLENVTKTTKNKEVKAQLNQIINEEEQSDATIAASIKNMEGRPGYLKFVIGEDYKNAGQVRSEVVHLRNQIAKLERVQEKAGASDSGAIAASIATFQAELNSIENYLYEKLQGFSLFGWLSKLLTGFTPTAIATPSASPEASPSGTPVATVAPTIEPTATP